MAQDLLPIWKMEFESLPKTAIPGAWQSGFASYVSQRVMGKLMIAPPVIGASTFTFNTAAFMAPLMSIVPSLDPVTGRTALANAWQAGVLASIMITAPGAYIGAPAPPTTFSVVTTTLVNPASVTAAYSTLLSGLMSIPPSIAPSIIPDLLYAAFASLMFDLSGLNSILPPAGPLPLLAPLTPVI